MMVVLQTSQNQHHNNYLEDKIMKSLKYKNVTLMFKHRIPRKKKKRAKKGIDMFSNDLVGDITFFIKAVKLNHR